MLHFEQPLANGRIAHLRFSDATDGDFAIADRSGRLHETRQALSGHEWTWLHQVHGAEVVVVNDVGEGAASHADAAITGIDNAVVAVQTADCVPVLFVGSNGMVGAAHAGWRGAAAGVLPATVEALRSRGCGELRAVVGPAIGPECYEFGPDDLDVVAAALGDEVRSRTATGSLALDLVAGVVVQLEGLDITTTDLGLCTACAGSYHSHRARADKGRQVAAAWIDSASLGYPQP